MEFAYNNSYHHSLKMSSYEALYDRKCQLPIHWHEVGERKFLGPENVNKVSEEIETIKKKIARFCGSTKEVYKELVMTFRV